MATEDQFSKTLQAGATLSKYQRVKISSGKLAAAVAADANAIGHLREDVVADQWTAVYLDGPVRTGIAANAITQGAVVYADASGELDDDSGTNIVGVALQAAAAANDFFEYMSNPRTVDT